ncbi:MAG: Asp-tRNA(Asn)/Glu-tRNA(Gln) amidotransferase subunit GatA [Candidatus Obscuribacterales bacterium]|nr:Asp-tRNA(Asn)/Glu-tRNA(Gln) amidotransferase subunit GatA [Candidatus Obscuribacterales bacterium]
MQEIVGLGIRELRQLLDKKQVSAQEILKAHKKQIGLYEKEVDAFICLTDELSQKQASLIDERIGRGERMPAMAGIPVAVKDNMCVPGYATTCASKILDGFEPAYEATAVSQIIAQGAVLIGKTNMDEFAMGSSTENSAIKKTRNPWNLNCVPGGSSGGSAAAVSAGFSTVALGSDTGGSIRQPAGFCGVVGMKPTYGMVSRFGLVAYASSLDQIGPFARSVDDAAITLTAIAGHDRRDSTSLEYFFDNQNRVTTTKNGTVDFSAGLSEKSPEELAGKMRIGIIKELIGEGIDENVRQLILEAAKTYEKMGAIVEEVSIPSVKHCLPVYYILATAEASANLARFDGVRYGYREKDAKDIMSMYLGTRQNGFGDEVKLRIMLGTHVLSTGYYDAYYKKAQQVRQLLKNEFDKVFSKYDVVISPTSPSVAFEFGSKTDDPVSMYLSDIASIPVNLGGLPGISIPCGFSKNSNHGSLPVGLQIVGSSLADAAVLQAAAAFEKATSFHNAKSPLLERVSV